MEILMPQETSMQMPFAKNGRSTGPQIVVRRSLPKPGAIFDTYWKFAAERQSIYFRRFESESGPWTTDPILKEYKFTNTYRAADRTSQYLIRNVIDDSSYGLRDTVFRILLFKIFNKIATWELLEEVIGRICEETFSIHEFDRILELAMQAKASIYSAAYIMPSGPSSIRQSRKHKMHLQLLASMLASKLPERISEAKSMQEAYELLLAIPSIGPFLAYQFITDLNYSNHFSFSEMEFVVPGPGAKDGIRKCFSSLGDFSEAETIQWVTERQVEEFEFRDLKFSSLWGRPLQLIDCQNVFCEVDKYSRVAHPEALGRSGRSRIKQRFTPATASLKSIAPFFPAKWNLTVAI